MAARTGRRPSGRVTETFVDGASRQGAYGLLESTAVEPAAVGLAMFAASARRAAQEPFVYCSVDGTSLTLTDHGQTKGFGPIGSRAMKGRGIKVMNAMLSSPEGVCLGISSQQWWTRPARARKKHRERLRPEEKETKHWLEAISQTREVFATYAPRTRCWFQLDREADAWPILTTAGAAGHWFTIRACRKRRVVIGEGKRSKLHQVLAKQKVLAEYPLEVRGTARRQARTARMVIRATKVTLDFKDKRTSRRFLMEVNVVQALERGTTPAGEKPIEWTLLTNRVIGTKKALTDVLFGYSMRWRIEELHRTWKTGACRVEDTQLRSTNAVIKWATILVAVAARIERIKQMARERPEQPATAEFSPLEIKAAALLRFGKDGNSRSKANPSIADVTLWIAELGGYTGRTSSGGPPGSITISRGLEDVLAAAKALQALGQ